MHKRTYERGWMRWLIVLAGLTGLAAVMFAWLSAASNDCWNGALSDDPLHCYVLEQV